MVLHTLGYLVPILALASQSDSPLAPTGNPSIISYVLTGLVTLLVLLTMFQFQGERDRRKLYTEDRRTTDGSIALINQALAVLVSQVTPVTDSIKTFDHRLDQVELSGALLRQALEAHILVSEQDRQRLNNNLDALRNTQRDGTIDDRRSVYRSRGESDGH